MRVLASAVRVARMSEMDDIAVRDGESSPGVDEVIARNLEKLNERARPLGYAVTCDGLTYQVRSATDQARDDVFASDDPVEVEEYLTGAR